MIEALITTYWNVKMERPEATRALYRSAVEIDNEGLIGTFRHRVDAAAAAMIATASDATFADRHIVNLSLLTTIFGTVRSIFDRNLSDAESRLVHKHLILMCVAYVHAVKMSPNEVAAA